MGDTASVLQDEKVLEGDAVVMAIRSLPCVQHKIVTGELSVAKYVVSQSK